MAWKFECQECERLAWIRAREMAGAYTLFYCKDQGMPSCYSQDFLGYIHELVRFQMILKPISGHIYSQIYDHLKKEHLEEVTLVLLTRMNGEN